MIGPNVFPFFYQSGFKIKSGILILTGSVRPALRPPTASGLGTLERALVNLASLTESSLGTFARGALTTLVILGTLLGKRAHRLSLVKATDTCSKAQTTSNCFH